MKHKLFGSISLTLLIFADFARSSPDSANGKGELDVHAQFINDAIVRELSQMQRRKKPFNNRPESHDMYTDTDSQGYQSETADGTDTHGHTSMVVGQDGTLSITVKVHPDKLRTAKSNGHSDSQSESSIVQNMIKFRPPAPAANVPNMFYNNPNTKQQQNTGFRQNQQGQKHQQTQSHQMQQSASQQLQVQPQQQKLNSGQQLSYKPQQGTLTDQQRLIQNQQKAVNDLLVDIISGVDKLKASDSHSGPKSQIGGEPPKKVTAVDNDSKVPVWFEPPKFGGNGNHQDKSPIRHEPPKISGGYSSQADVSKNQTQNNGEMVYTTTYEGPVEHIYTLSQVAEIVSNSVKRIPGNLRNNLRNLAKDARRAYRKKISKIRRVPAQIRKKLPKIKIIKPKDSIIWN